MAEHTLTYDSVDELARRAVKFCDDRPIEDRQRQKWSGANSWEQALALARDGWDKETKTAITLAEEAIETVQAELDDIAFKATWDMAGCEVDVGRFLSGVPENMIEYEVVPTTKYGRVITLCSSFSISAAVSPGAIKRRGYAVTALAFALSRLGYAIELYSDFSTTNDGDKAHVRVLVKGANDELDPARIMFAYAHPAMLRVLGLAAMHELPKSMWRDDTPMGWGYGSPINPTEDLPEGTIYLPCVYSDRDVPDAASALKRYLRDLGIVE